jgi:hypothetical protein
MQAQAKLMDKCMKFLARNSRGTLWPFSGTSLLRGMRTTTQHFSVKDVCCHLKVQSVVLSADVITELVQEKYSSE